MLRRAFTTIEMIIVMFIMISIGLILIVNIRSGINSDELRIARSHLIQDLKKMQNFAIAGKVCKAGDAPACTDPGITNMDYGVEIIPCNSPPCRYKLYADAENTTDSKYTSANELLADGEKDIYGNRVQVRTEAYNPTTSSWQGVSLTVNILFKAYNAQILILVGADTTFTKVKVILQKDSRSSQFIVDKVSGTIIEEPEPTVGNGNS